MWKSYSGTNIRVKVSPIRIVAFDQLDFRIPGTCLYLFFSRNGLVHTFDKFKVNQLCQIVFGTKSFRNLVLMLPYSPWQIAGDPCVQGAIWLVGENVYSWLFIHHIFLICVRGHPLSVAKIRRLLRYARNDGVFISNQQLVSHCEEQSDKAISKCLIFRS